MSQHEQAPEHFVTTFNSAWGWGLRAAGLIGTLLLAMFFYNLYDSFAAFFTTLVLVAVAYGLWRLCAALLIGPPDPDTDDAGH